MFYRAGLAVHQLFGAHHVAPKRLANGLMSQAHTQNRRFARHMPDQRNQNSCLARRARPRRKQNSLRLERLDLLHRQLIVAPHLYLRTQLAQVLHQVEGERVVVVENENHRDP